MIAGGGNPTGGSFTGPSQSLELTGDFAYSYSGQVDLDSTTKTLSQFTTGNYLFVGQFQMIFDKTQFNTGESIGYTIDINGVTIARLELEAAATTTEALQQPLDLIIPPYTTVHVQGDTDAGGIIVTGLMTGRIYRA